MITLSKDDNDSNIESYCVTNNARQPRVCMRKNKTNTWVKRVSERPKRGQNSLNQAKIAETRPKGTKGDKRAILIHVSLFFFFLYTRVGVLRC